MNPSRFRPSDARASSPVRVALVLGLALGSGLACTAIFKPDDSVQRCGTGDDCDDTEDNRYDAVCRFDPEHVDYDSTKIDKICVAEFKVNISCDPTSYTAQPGSDDLPFQDKMTECETLDLACDEAKLGSIGCALDPVDGCDPGLERQDNICIDPQSDIKIYSSSTFKGQDVQDQFCKSFFCDEDFVCDNSSDDPKCTRCDPESEFGKGGCGLLYANGVPSPVYRLGADLEENCAGPGASPYEPLFGDCP